MAWLTKNHVCECNTPPLVECDKCRVAIFKSSAYEKEDMWYSHVRIIYFCKTHVPRWDRKTIYDKYAADGSGKIIGYEIHYTRDNVQCDENGKIIEGVKR